MKLWRGKYYVLKGVVYGTLLGLILCNLFDKMAPVTLLYFAVVGLLCGFIADIGIQQSKPN